LASPHLLQKPPPLFPCLAMLIDQCRETQAGRQGGGHPCPRLPAHVVVILEERGHTVHLSNQVDGALGTVKECRLPPLIAEPEV
jgi:hypothetical protein